MKYSKVISDIMDHQESDTRWEIKKKELTCPLQFLRLISTPDSISRETIYQENEITYQSITNTHTLIKKKVAKNNCKLRMKDVWGESPRGGPLPPSNGGVCSGYQMSSIVQAGG